NAHPTPASYTLSLHDALPISAMDLHRHGVLAQFGVEMIGARADVIDKAEDRQKFKDAMIKIGLDVPRSGVARSLAQAQEIRESRSEEHTSELQSRGHLVCRLL